MVRHVLLPDKTGRIGLPCLTHIRVRDGRKRSPRSRHLRKRLVTRPVFSVPASPGTFCVLFTAIDHICATQLFIPADCIANVAVSTGLTFRNRGRGPKDGHS